MIEENKSLQSLNTFGIDAVTRYYTQVNSVSELQQLMQSPVYRDNKKLIIGGGSNLLFTQNFSGLTIHNCIKGIAITERNANTVIVKAGAGEVWHQFVLWCIEQNFAGIENLSLIPGSVGASPMQNIGAYGVEIKDVFYQLEAVDLQTGNIEVFTKTDCAFGYRESVFKHALKDRYMIVSVSFMLTDLNAPNTVYTCKTAYGDIKNTLSEMQVYEPTIKDVSRAVCKIRSTKLPNPAELGNAGSFFKNPSISSQAFEKLVQQYPVMPSFVQPDQTYKIPAGWLIEQCGWKGKVVGNTGAHKMQALVLVNYGNATGREVLDLANAIQQSVRDKFGIEITPEVNVL